MRREPNYLFDFHCAHLIGLLTLVSIPILVANQITQDAAFSEWEVRKFNTTELIEPMVPYCDSALQAIYESQPGGWKSLIDVLRGEMDTVDIITSLVLGRVDAPWWYITDTGPSDPCSRLVVMVWDMLGFRDVNNTLGTLEGMDCGQEGGGLCGGRLLGLLGDAADSAGFPLVYDIDLLGVTVETEGMGYYKFADRLVWVLPVGMAASVLYWLINGETKHFMKVYVAIWIFYFLVLLFPFPAFVIPKINADSSLDVKNYETHLIRAFEEDQRVDYYVYLQWLVNMLFNLMTIFLFQYPYVILIGAFAIFFAVTDSLQAIGQEDVHTIATVLEVMITGAIAFSAISALAALTTFRKSMEISIDEDSWIYFDDQFPEPFINDLTLGFYVTGFLFIYMNFLFERLAFWHNKWSYTFLRYMCIAIGIMLFISGSSSMKVPSSVPFSYFIYVMGFCFGYNFVVGRFVFFMFFRPEIVEDSDFGWYRVAMSNTSLIEIKPMFKIPNRSKGTSTWTEYEQNIEIAFPRNEDEKTPQFGGSNFPTFSKKSSLKSPPPPPRPGKRPPPRPIQSVANRL